MIQYEIKYASTSSNEPQWIQFPYKLPAAVKFSVHKVTLWYESWKHKYCAFSRKIPLFFSSYVYIICTCNRIHALNCERSNKRLRMHYRVIAVQQTMHPQDLPKRCTLPDAFRTRNKQTSKQDSSQRLDVYFRSNCHSFVCDLIIQSSSARLNRHQTKQRHALMCTLAVKKLCFRNTLKFECNSHRAHNTERCIWIHKQGPSSRRTLFGSIREWQRRSVIHNGNANAL